MSERKLIIEVDINDDAGGSIEDLEREILAPDIYGQAARKYRLFSNSRETDLHDKSSK